MTAAKAKPAAKSTVPPLTVAAPPRFDLRAFARDAASNATTPDPHVLADMVVSDLPEEHLRAALRQCLPEWLRTVLNTSAAATRSAPRGKHLSSADRVRNWYAQTLATRLFTGEGWKFLRDCTAADLHVAAVERYKAAAATRTEGDRFANLAALMEESGAETVADVSPDALRCAFGGAA